MKGNYNEELLKDKDCEYYKLRKTLSNLATKEIFTYPEIYKTEISGAKAINFIIKHFLDELVLEFRFICEIEKLIKQEKSGLINHNDFIERIKSLFNENEKIEFIENDFINEIDKLIGENKELKQYKDKFINEIKKLIYNYQKIKMLKNIKDYRLISKNYRAMYEKNICNLDNKNENYFDELYYYTFLLITDYVSGMTDSYCINLYRKLNAIDIY